MDKGISPNSPRSGSQAEIGSGAAMPRRVPVTSSFPHFAAWLPVAAVLVPLSILAVVGWLNWRAVWDDAQTDMARAAESAAEYGKRTLESYSLAAGRINDRLRGLSDAEITADERTLQSELKRIGAELSQSELAYVIDSKGYALLASNRLPAPRGSTLSDRDYFQALAAAEPPDVYVSRTFVGRFDGRLLFSVARRRRDTGNPPTPDGFDGVVLISVSPVVLAEGMERLLPQPTDRMALVRADGHGISTTSGLLDLGQPLPQVDPDSPFYEFASEAVESAVYVSSTAIPGSSAMLAMHLIDGFPIYAVAVRSRAEIVSRWWGIVASQLAFGVPATLGLLFLSLWVQRDQSLLASANAALRRDNDLSTDRLDRAKRFGLVGTFEFNPLTGISRRSQEYMSIHGLAPIASDDSHEDWVRRLHPDDRHRAESELRKVLADAGATDYAQTYRIITATGDIRWIAARGEIERDGEGRAVMLLGAHVDVTPLRTTELALAESDARLRLTQEAVGIGAWEWLRATRTLVCSRKMLELWGFDPDRDSPSFADIVSRVHPDDRRDLRRVLGDMKRTGGFSGEFRVQRPAVAGMEQTLWIAVRAKQATFGDAAHRRLMGVAYDITDRKRDEERTILMAHEVEHRAKNALTVVSSLLRMTRADTVQQLTQVMDGRIRALSQTMALLGKGRWESAELGAIIESELRPFELARSGDGFVIELSGPTVLVDVDVAQPLAMALHELATNAAKYGALSVPGGGLTVTWWADGQHVHLLWREQGGPSLDGPPPRKGFGSRLIAMLFEGQIGGVVERRWETEGLVCEMSFPSSFGKRDRVV